MITNNANIVGSMLALGTVDMMLEQISTGWKPAIKDIFMATSGSNDSG
jgi:hypothetical protein